jgi:hypothetical protein
MNLKKYNEFFDYPTNRTSISEAEQLENAIKDKLGMFGYFPLDELIMKQIEEFTLYIIEASKK